MPRLVRRAPLKDRVLAWLNPADFLLWLSEEIETREIDANVVGTQVGLAANFIFLVARAQRGTPVDAEDDVFGDDDRGPGWWSYIVRRGSAPAAATSFMSRPHVKQDGSVLTATN